VGNVEKLAALLVRTWKHVDPLEPLERAKHMAKGNRDGVWLVTAVSRLMEEACAS
jgi:hypothetical protein